MKITGKKKEDWRCLFCGAPAKADYDYKQICCNSVCYENYRHQQALEEILSGERPGYVGKTCVLSKTLRRHLADTRGTACSKCGWDEKHPVDRRPLTEINHIDGDAKNCSLENLEILCPNCHSMTVNFRARNKKSSRLR